MIFNKIKGRLIQQPNDSDVDMLNYTNKHKWPFIPNFYDTLSSKLSTKIVNKIIDNSINFKFQRKKLQNGIYIFLYHSVVDLNTCTQWEKVYTKVMTEKDYFEEHINFLCDHATNIKLSAIPELLKNGKIDKPYFVITFDDGYKNILPNTLPLCIQKNIYPTVFLNANFVDTSTVYYRILCALLINKGYENKIINALEKILNVKISSYDNLLGFTKDNYTYQLMEKAIYSVWNEIKSNDIHNQVHLQWKDLFILQDNGWEFGNHTLNHPILSKLSYEQQKFEIETNFNILNDNGLQCIKWLSYPNGAVKHVDSNTFRWLNKHKDWNAIFACGGINFFPSRTEWLRIGIGNDNLKNFISKINKNEYVMKRIVTHYKKLY